MDASRYQAYVGLRDESMPVLLADNHSRTSLNNVSRLLVNRHHAIDTAANAPFAAASTLNSTLNVGLQPYELLNAIAVVAGRPTFGGAPARDIVFAIGRRHVTMVGSEKLTSQVL